MRWKNMKCFLNLVSEAAEAGKKLKFVAKYEEGKASVGLQHIDPHHDFIIYMEKIMRYFFLQIRYTKSNLVVKGAGAGAEK